MDFKNNTLSIELCWAIYGCVAGYISFDMTRGALSAGIPRLACKATIVLGKWQGSDALTREICPFSSGYIIQKSFPIVIL